ncbi:transporter [Sesbania bispinosa]|nr:transporter [Sesbania bispinosa]
MTYVAKVWTRKKRQRKEPTLPVKIFTDQDYKKILPKVNMQSNKPSKEKE